MIRAVSAFEVSTDSLRQVGHLNSEAMALTRSVLVRGPRLPATPMTSATSNTGMSTSHARWLRFCSLRSAIAVIRHPADCDSACSAAARIASRPSLVTPPVILLTTNPLGSMHERLGDAGDAVVERGAALGIGDDRPLAAVVLEEALHIGLVVAEHDAHDLGVAGLQVSPAERDQLGMLLLARCAPRGEEVDDDERPAAVGQLVLGPVRRRDRRADDVGRRFAEERALPVSIESGRPCREDRDERHHPEAEHDRDDEADVTAGPNVLLDADVFDVSHRRQLPQVRRPAPRAVASARGVRGSGADTGSVGRRRRPGHAASTVPTAITPPPIHSHTASGMMSTRSRDRPRVVGRAASSSVRYTSSAQPGAHRRRADRVLPTPGTATSAGA